MLILTTDGGAGTGPQGALLRVRLQGWSPCRQVAVGLTSHYLLVSLHVSGNGVADQSELTPPPGAGPGRYEALASCTKDPKLRATATFNVTPSSYHILFFPIPRHLRNGLRDLLSSLLLALFLLLVIGFPGELFERTLEDHSAEVRDWFRAVPSLPALPPAVAYVGFVAIAALLASLDAKFSLTTNELASLLGTGVETVIITLGFALPAALVVTRRYHERGAVRVLPLGIVIAVVAALLSKAFHVEPAYVYGLVAGIVFTREFGRDEDGQLTAVTVATMLVLSLAAYVGLRLSPSPSPHSFVGVMVYRALSLLVESGLATTLMTLIPMRFLYGRKIADWDRRLWAALFVLTAFAYIHIVAEPSSRELTDTRSHNLAMMLTLFVAVGAGSLLFWLYFRLREGHEHTTPEVDGRAR